MSTPDSIDESMRARNRLLRAEREARKQKCEEIAEDPKKLAELIDEAFNMSRAFKELEKSHAKELEKLKQTHEQEQDSFESRLRALESSLSLAQERASGAEASLKLLQDEMAPLQELSENFEAQLETERKSLIEEGKALAMKEASGAHRRRGDELKEANAKLAELAPKLLELEELGALRTQIKNNEKWKELNAACRNKLDQIQEELTNKEILCASHLQELEEANEVIEDLRSELASAKEILKEAQTKLEGFDLQTAELNEAQTNLRLSQDRIKELEMDLAQAEDNSKFRQENIGLKAELTTANRKLREAENNCKTQVARLERQNKSLQTFAKKASADSAKMQERLRKKI